MDKPSWKDAPDWANWLAQDADGEWYWYESEPRVEMEDLIDPSGFTPRDSVFEQTSFAGQSHHNEHWRDTLEQRLTPRSLVCFNQVAGVIGEDAAEHELQRVIGCGLVGRRDYESANSNLVACFTWKDSPQGEEFWVDVYRGRVPPQLQAIHWDGITWPIPAGQVCIIQYPYTEINYKVTVNYMDETHCIWHEVGGEQTNHSKVKCLTFKPVKSDVQKAREEIMGKLEDFTGNDCSALTRTDVVEFVLNMIEDK